MQNKKYIDLTISIFPVRITFCPTKKIHRKYLNKNHEWMSKTEIEFECDAVTTVVKENGSLSLVVGLDYKKGDDIYIAKSLIVHELSHVVTNIFEFLGIDCDEVRSYTMQALYENAMIFFDNHIECKK